MEIKIKVKDKMDVALLLTGINILRQNNILKAKQYLDLPKKFKKSKIINELIDDYDRLNTLGEGLSKLIEEIKK